MVAIAIVVSGLGCAGATSPGPSPSPANSEAQAEPPPPSRPVASTSPAPVVTARLAPPLASAAPTAPSALGLAREREPEGEPAPSIHDPGLLASLTRLERYCEPALSRTGGRLSAGCACCPPFDDCAPRADGRRFVLDTVYPLRSEVDGAFTEAGARETAAVFFGCESHAENFGGTLVVRSTVSASERRVYRSGVNGEPCQAVRRPDGRDWLVCRSKDAHQGVGRTSVVAVDLALAEDDSAASDMLLDGIDNLVSVCTWGAEDPPPAIAFSDVAFRVLDADGDGWNDVEVTARVRRGIRTSALARACSAWTARASGSPGRPPYFAIGPVRALKLEFRLQGSRFVPTADTRKTLEDVFAGYDAEGDSEAAP
jgi:hypothetical protein